MGRFVYLLYDSCSSGVIAYFSTREKAEKYMEDEITAEKKWCEENGEKYNEEFYHTYVHIIEEPLDKEYKWGCDDREGGLIAE